MDLTFSEKEIAFRDELREWLASNHPDAAPTEGRTSRVVEPRTFRVGATYRF